MKIGILTITGGENFGNRLQNYALQEYLKQFGVQAETIRNYTKAEDEYKILIQIKKHLKWLLAVLAQKTKINNHNINKWNRQRRFNAFNKKYIRISKFTVS